MPKIRIALTGGGSGGHVYPLLAVMEELKRLSRAQTTDLEMVHFGPKDAFAPLFANAGMQSRGIMGAKLRSYSTLQNIVDIPKFFIGLLQAFWKLFWYMPDVIFSKGGPGAFPVVFAGWFYKIPVIIHESDAIPGATNVLSSHFATRIAITFEKAKLYFDPARTATIGNPVRPWILCDKPDPKTAKQLLGFNPEAPLTAVLGGSQGSQRINEFIIANLPAILKETQLYHQTGTSNFGEMEALAKAETGNTPAYKAVPYITEDIKNVLAAADCIVGRAGSGTISEAAAFGKPMILIPLPESANDHQRANAREFEKIGGGIIIEEANFLSGIFISTLKKILTDPAVKTRMQAASASFFKPEAAEIIAKEILLLGKQ